MIRDFKDSLKDIILAIDKSEEFVRGMTFEQFEKDDKTVFAVIRALEIIGEAVKHIPAVVRNRNKFIPWVEMAGMRNKLLHEYFGVNARVVWKTVKQDLPSVKGALEAMI